MTITLYRAVFISAPIDIFSNQIRSFRGVLIVLSFIINRLHQSDRNLDSYRPTMRLFFCMMVGLLVLNPNGKQTHPALAGDEPTLWLKMSVDIDATDLPRKLLYGTVMIPVDSFVGEEGGDMVLWYPKWMPGTHGPGGPIQNVAGTYITDENGERIEWDREPGEVYEIVCHVPKGVHGVVVETRYITNQPDASSDGVDSFGSELIGFVNANTILRYPSGIKDNEIEVTSSIKLPEEWKAASALRVKEEGVDDDGYPVIHYEPVTLERFVDSPIMVGRYTKDYDLVEDGMKDKTVPQVMHLFSEAESVLDIPDDVYHGYQRMVTQEARLFGSQPFERFDFLVATTNELGRNGLEHISSTFNVIGQRSLQSFKGLRGWDEMLLPHEYTHSWCGKYRRPAGMVTHDFNTPKDTDLLWVYEGLTQYIGKVIEARAELMTEEEFEWELYRMIRSARHRQGRDWRTLSDTAAASHILRGGSRRWSQLRRGQDYYMEGMLLWMEADAIIRNKTDGEKSLDDFCQVFFKYRSGEENPLGYDREEIINTLNGVVEYDWADFIHRRVDEPEEQFGLGLLKELGYQLQYGNTPPEGPNDSKVDLLDARDSIGASFSSDGGVRSVLLGSPADDAGLGPDMKIVGVGEFVWSRDRFVDAIADTARTGHIDLMMVSGDKYVTKRVEYDGGPRFMRLVKADKKNTRLHDIVSKREE